MFERKSHHRTPLRRIWTGLLGAAALCLAVPVGAAQMPATAQADMSGVLGTWLNPHSSVAVRTGLCNGKLCGWIVWANHAAQDDARDSGVARLVGTELLEDYARQDARHWSGTVYVPDMGHHFSSTITQAGPDMLQVKGCLIGGFICKSQNWRRIESLPDA